MKKAILGLLMFAGVATVSAQDNSMGATKPVETKDKEAKKLDSLAKLDSNKMPQTTKDGAIIEDKKTKKEKKPTNN